MENKNLYPKATQELADKKAALVPKNIEAWRNFSKTAFEAGTLDEKTKQLIAVAVAHVTQCPYCTKAHLDEWNKEVALSTELRKWFDHKAEQFDEFANLYREELMTKEKELNRLRTIAQTKSVTLVYGAKDPQINYDIILRNILLHSNLNS